jgi:ribosomal protein S4E
MKYSEKDIEDYFCENIHKIDDDLEFFRRQYIVNHRKKRIGIIDILCVQGEDKRYVIIENKKEKLKGRDIGQVLAYYKIFKNIDKIGSAKKRDPKIILICTEVDVQFELAYEVIDQLDIDLEVKKVQQNSDGELYLVNYFDKNYTRLKLTK